MGKRKPQEREELRRGEPLRLGPAGTLVALVVAVPIGLWFRVLEPTVPTNARPTVTVLPPRTLRQLEERVAAASDTFGEVEIVEGMHSPPSFLLRGFLSPAEVAGLFGLVRSGWAKHQEPRSSTHGTLTLDKVPALNASAPIQALNAKIATLVGMPEEHIEEGYFTVYVPGHELSSLHLDNHHALMWPPRVVSLIFYLNGEESGVVGGRTVFPLSAEAGATEEEVRLRVASAWRPGDGTPHAAHLTAEGPPPRPRRCRRLCALARRRSPRSTRGAARAAAASR